MSAVLSTFDDSPRQPGYSPDRQIAQLRIPPHSIEGESSVLGGLLLDNAAWDRVGDLLMDQDFYRAEHKLIYAAVGALINATKPADVITAVGGKGVLAGVGIRRFDAGIPHFDKAELTVQAQGGGARMPTR